MVAFLRSDWICCKASFGGIQEISSYIILFLSAKVALSPNFRRSRAMTDLQIVRIGSLV